jgi:hypothetical protein
MVQSDRYLTGKNQQVEIVILGADLSRFYNLLPSLSGENVLRRFVIDLRAPL